MANDPEEIEEISEQGMRDAVKNALEEAFKNRKLIEAVASGEVPPSEMQGFLQIVCETDPEGESEDSMITKVTSVGSMSAIVTALSSLQEMLVKEALKSGDTPTLTALIETSIASAAVLAKASKSGIDEEGVRQRMLKMLSELTDGAISLRSSSSNTVH